MLRHCLLPSLKIKSLQKKYFLVWQVLLCHSNHKYSIFKLCKEGWNASLSHLWFLQSFLRSKFWSVVDIHPPSMNWSEKVFPKSPCSGLFFEHSRTHQCCNETKNMLFTISSTLTLFLPGLCFQGYCHFSKKMRVLAARLGARNFTRALGYAKHPLSVVQFFAVARFRSRTLPHPADNAPAQLHKELAWESKQRNSINPEKNLDFFQNCPKFQLFFETQFFSRIERFWTFHFFWSPWKKKSNFLNRSIFAKNRVSKKSCIFGQICTLS